MRGEKENSLPRVQHSCVVFSQVLEFLGKNSIYLLCNDFFMRDEVPVCLQLTTESRMTLNILSSFLSSHVLGPQTYANHHVWFYRNLFAYMKLYLSWVQFQGF